MRGVSASSFFFALCKRARISDWRKWDCKMKEKVEINIQEPKINTCDAKGFFVSKRSHYKPC